MIHQLANFAALTTLVFICILLLLLSHGILLLVHVTDDRVHIQGLQSGWITPKVYEDAKGISASWKKALSA